MVSYMNNPSDDDYPGGGWCGYLAYDQIRRKSPKWADIKDPRDIENLISSRTDMVTYGPGVVRPNWINLPSKVNKLPKEVVLSVIETLKQSSSFLPTPHLRSERWIPMILINGSCQRLGYSIWTMDPEDDAYNCLQDGPRSRGSVTNLAEWEEILVNRMMTGRRNHFHVRDSHFVHELHTAIEAATLYLESQRKA